MNYKDIKQNKTAEWEKPFILEAIEKNNWNLARVVKYLGISRASLYYYMKIYGIKRPEIKRAGRA